MMERIGFFCLLLCGSVRMISNETSTIQTPSTDSINIIPEGAETSGLQPKSNASSNSEEEETLHQSEKEGRIAILRCGRLTSGKVTWSRDTNGQRVDILTTHNGQTTKHIADPDRRYSAGANLALTIFRASQSDAGRYYCGGATVELSVTDRKCATLYSDLQKRCCPS
ncbi:hypothetical protein MHYP_G00170230 [Metynnis hypsauchen]